MRRIPTIMFAVLLSTFAHADWCRDAVELLGNGPSSGSEREPLLREVLLKEMASLYLEALQDRTLMPAFLMRLSEMASIEKQPEIDLYHEIEALSDSPSGLKAIQEVREVRKREEYAQLHAGLEPYLDRIGRKDREIIENELILRGLVFPLNTGEVEFKFQGKHRFIVGAEEVSGGDEGKKKEVSFGPRHGFAIGQVPVTQFMYFLAALGDENAEATPSHFKEGEGSVVLRLDDGNVYFKPNHPVESVSVVEAEAHAARVSKITGVRYGLPTEIQWEFSNRAGSIGTYHFGDDRSLLSEYGWFNENSNNKSHPVGQLLPNAFNLYDMHGNVWEWTASRDGSHRIYRGGGWSDDNWFQRSAVRLADPVVDFYGRGYRRSNRGLRLVRENPGNTPPAHTFTLAEPHSTGKLGHGASNALRSLYQSILNRLPGLGRFKK
jgi:formylglycine-generating enzyme required for sulfatase activity